MNALNDYSGHNRGHARMKMAQAVAAPQRKEPFPVHPERVGALFEKNSPAPHDFHEFRYDGPAIKIDHHRLLVLAALAREQVTPDGVLTREEMQVSLRDMALNDHPDTHRAGQELDAYFKNSLTPPVATSENAHSPVAKRATATKTQPRQAAPLTESIFARLSGFKVTA